MAQQLKRWESPRRPGRNHKGRGGSARQRQIRKRSQGLRQRLRGDAAPSPHTTTENYKKLQETTKKESQGSPFLWPLVFGQPQGHEG